MCKSISLFIFYCLFALLTSSRLYAQVAKGTGIFFFASEPTLPVNVCYDGEVGIDTSTGLWWEYSRDLGFWVPAGFRVQKTTTCVKPTYTPVDKQSEVVLTPCDSLYRWRDGQWWHLNKHTANTDHQDLSIGGSGPSYTIDITNGAGVTISPSGIVVLNESPANTLVIGAFEVDGDTTNEIQVIDTFAIANDTLRISLSKDNQPFKFVSLSQYLDNTDTSGYNLQFWRSNDTLFVRDGAGVLHVKLPQQWPGLNGIYGDGITPGSGSDTLPPGGSTITIPGEWQPLKFNLSSAASQTWTAIDVSTSYCADDVFIRYFVGRTSQDSLFLYNYDCGAILEEKGGTLTIKSDETIDVLADSISISAPTDTVARYLVAQTTQQYIKKIEGQSPGQVMKWDGSKWILGVDQTGAGSTDLTFSGTSSPVTLNSSTGSDVTFSAGTGITLSATSTNMTINAVPADGSETKVQGANGIIVTGSGTNASPYLVSPPSGSNTQTLRYNGSTLQASSALRNNGIQISVNGSAVGSNLLTVNQSGSTDGILVKQSSSPSKGLRLYNTSTTSFVDADSLTLSMRSASQVRLEPIGGNILTQAFIIPQNAITLNSANTTLLSLHPTYSPSSAGGSFNFLMAGGVINQSGSANQDIRGISFQPSLSNVLGQLYGFWHEPAIGRFLWQPNGDTVYSHLRGRLGLGPSATTSSHRLFVDGTMRLTGSSGTATTLMGRNGTGEVSSVSIGSGLTLSGGTLSATAGSGLDGAENGLTVVSNKVRLGGDLIVGTTINHASNLLHFRNGPWRISWTNTAGSSWNQRIGFRGLASNPSTSATPTSDGILDIHAENSDGTSTNTSLTVGAMATNANGMWVQARQNDTYNNYLPLHLNPRGGAVAVGAGASSPAARFTVQSSGQTGTGVAGLSQLLVHSEGHGEVRLGFGNTISTHGSALSWRSSGDVLRVINLNTTNGQSRLAFSIGGYDQTNEVATIVKSSASTLARAGFGFNSPSAVHSTLQSSGSLATSYLETAGAPTFDETKHQVVYVGTTNVTWSIPSATACNCQGRQYILHNASASSTITLSNPVSKANNQTFNTLAPGEWAHIFYGSSIIRGYKLTSN